MELENQASGYLECMHNRANWTLLRRRHTTRPSVALNGKRSLFIVGDKYAVEVL